MGLENMGGNAPTDPLVPPPSGPRYDDILAELERLYRALGSTSAPRRARLLKYLVDQALSGQGDKLNEYSIGVDVFDKLPSFDPRIDSIVRTNIGRLRQRMRDYYAADGKHDPVIIDVSPGSYLATIHFRDAASESVEPEPVAAPPPTVASPKRRRWILAAALVVAALTVAGILWRRVHASPQIHSIIVLPFQDDSSGRQSGYLADGLTDEITNDLANLNGLRVIARTTAFEFKNKGIDIRDIGRQLNVDASLEGSLDREGNRLRIRAQLNRNSDGYHLWSHAYDVQFRDLIAVQRDIARSIADDLQLSRSLDADSAPHPPHHDPDPEAHELYLRGADAWNAATYQSFLKGSELFQAAVQKDPLFAQAWLGLANAHWNVGIYGGWNGVTAAQVESEAQRALDLDPSMASAHATLAQIVWRHELDWPRAESEFRLALKYGAGTYNVHNLYAGCLAERGDFAECHRQFHTAQELSPLQDALFTNEAAIYAAEGKPAEAERELQTVLARKPGFAIALADLAFLKFETADCSAADPYVTELQKASPGSRIAGIAAWSLLVCRGKLPEAREALKAAAPELSRIDLAAAHARLGDFDQALDMLEAAYRDRDVGITALRLRLEFIPLRTNPRFVALEEKIGLTR